MKDNNRHSITLQAYDIENDDVDKKHSDLMEKLKEKLSLPDETVRNRCMPLNAGSPEEDLLSDYAIQRKYIFGVMWRISPADGSPTIPDDFFNHTKIQIKEIVVADEQAPSICKDHYYFALNKDYLVTNLPKSRIKPLQTYLNWLLTAARGDKLYRFTPKIEAPQATKLSDIQNIVFSDPRKKNKKKEQENEENNFKVYNFATDALKRLIVEIPALQEMIEKKILSAKLLVKFKKPQKMDENDYKKLLGAYMKPISDTDGVSFKLNNGKTIKGSDILHTKTVDVEKLDKVRISEQELMQEMEQFLRELNK